MRSIIRPGLTSFRPKQRLKIRVCDDLIDQGSGAAHFGSPQIPVGINEPRSVLGPNIARTPASPHIHVDQPRHLRNGPLEAGSRFITHCRRKQPICSYADIVRGGRDEMRDEGSQTVFIK